MTKAEKIYLKTIFHLDEKKNNPITTNTLSCCLKTTPAAVTAMVKKLAKKNLINYQKYQGVIITVLGKKMVMPIIRSYRLWKVFLMQKLYISEENIVKIATELSCSTSILLTNHLDRYLAHPIIDPYGDPIPDIHGNVQTHNHILLTELKENDTGIIKSYLNHTPGFLHYLKKRGIKLESKVKVIEQFSFDNSMDIIVNNYINLNISFKIGKNIYIQPMGDN